jgi:hypothetical protein
LVIDRIPKAELSLDDMIDRLLRMVRAGLRKPGAEPSSETAVRPNLDWNALSASWPGVSAPGKGRAMK